MNTMQEFQIEVFNAYGQQQEVHISENTPDFSELPKGVYIIRFRQGEDTYTEDFIKR